MVRRDEWFGNDRAYIVQEEKKRQDAFNKLKQEYLERLKATMQCEGVLDKIHYPIEVDSSRKGPKSMWCLPSVCEMNECPVVRKAMREWDEAHPELLKLRAKGKQSQEAVKGNGTKETLQEG